MERDRSTRGDLIVSMIFPGMDPYLEHPRLWTGFHHTLITYIRDYLRPLLQPRYIAAVEDRVYREGADREIVPDVWVRREQAKPQKQPRSPTQSSLASLEEETPLLVKVPALEVHEGYITILDRRSGQKVVTVIEVASPTNKYAGPGRGLYKTKQREVLASGRIDYSRPCVPRLTAEDQAWADELIRQAGIAPSV